MWSLIKKILGRKRSSEICDSAVNMAISELARLEPEYEIYNGEIIADDSNDWKIAVYYQKPGTKTKPPRYIVFSVSKCKSTISQIEIDHDSRYWITGRK